jgi:hypothetical protein
MPFVSRTRATLRRAEFGFLGVCVMTARADAALLRSAGERRVFTFALAVTRPLRTS